MKSEIPLTLPSPREGMKKLLSITKSALLVVPGDGNIGAAGIGEIKILY